MIEYLKLNGVGPAPNMLIEFGPRLNIITGDNGLGKTFALDIAWWSLTRTWSARPAVPRPNAKGTPTIEYTIKGKTGEPTGPITAQYDKESQDWTAPAGRPPMPGMVVYVRIDGGFSIWDPARNYWKRLSARGFDQPDRPEAFHFTPEQLWQGLTTPKGTVFCNGLIRDWITWQFQKPELYAAFTAVLAGLSPHETERLRPGKPVRSSILDARDEPTLELPYGTIPITLASAGMRRIISLAYALVWAWAEHQEAAAILHQRPTDRIVLLIDEAEAHLHPQWQRVLLPAIMDVLAQSCFEQLATNVQLLVTTHAPLVLASVESRFDMKTDRLITFNLSPGSGEVLVATEPWAKQGDVLGWLVSETFGLKQARSLEAENAIEAAEAFMRKEPTEKLPPGLQNKREIHAQLLRTLPGHDPFWPRWIVSTEEGHS